MITMPTRPSELGAEVLVEGREEAKEAAEQDGTGLTVFTDGSRVETGASGYAVVWRKKRRKGWASTKAHMGFNQEAFDAECAALARVLEWQRGEGVPRKGLRFFGCASSNSEDHVRRTRPRTTVRPESKEVDSTAESSKTRHQH